MPYSLRVGYIISIYIQPPKIMYDTYSTTFKYGNYNTYGELCLDDVNVWDFEFPLTADELEDAVNEQIGQAEAQAEALIADYYTY